MPTRDVPSRLALIESLPAKLGEAMLRGAMGQCPRCGLRHGMFARFLKPVSRCRACGQDWTLHRADDFPPYCAIFITGHVMAPVMIALGSSDALPVAALTAIALLLASVMVIGLLQPLKGAIIALQWWMGMHDFEPAGRDEAKAGATPDV